MYYTYILKSKTYPGAIYIGSTRDLKKRITQHNQAGSRYYSKRHAPWELETYIAFSELKQAKALEKHLKSSSGKAFMKKRLLSDSFNKDLKEFRNGRSS